MNIIFRLLIVIALQLFSPVVNSQNLSITDSLWIEVENNTGSEKVDNLLILGEALWSISYDSALQVGEMALQISKEIDYQAGYRFSLGNIAGSYFRMGDNIQSLKFYEESLELFKEAGSPNKLAIVYSNIGNVYYNISDFENALDCYLHTLELFEGLGDSAGIARSYNNIAFLYKAESNFDEAYKYYQKALFIVREIKNKHSESYILNNIGTLFSSKGDKEEALKFYLKSLALKKDLDEEPISKAVSLNNIAEIYNNLEDYDKAFEYYQEAYDISIKYGNAFYEANIGFNLSQLFLKMDNKEKALEYLLNSHQIAKDISARTLQVLICKSLSDYYESINKWEIANHYLKELNSNLDSIHSEESTKRIAEMQVKFETSRINQDLEILQKEKEIDDLIMSRTKTFNIILIVSFFFIFIIGILLLSRYRVRQKTAAILELNNKELQQSNATKDRFFAILAHDLKNHLIAFMNISDLLAEKFNVLTEDKKHNLIKRISKSSGSLYRLMDNLLKWALSQTNRITFSPGEYDLAVFVERTFIIYSVLADRKDITLTSSVTENTFVFADRNMLYTILRNLINNAIKFTPENGAIQVSSIVKDGFVVINVIDNGEGISQEKLERLFKFDVSNKSVRNSPEKGTGLGLLLCKEFVEKNGGYISVESEINKGSIFTFSLPMK